MIQALEGWRVTINEELDFLCEAKHMEEVCDSCVSMDSDDVSVSVCVDRWATI